MEKLVEVKVYEVRMYCDCGGEMANDGYGITNTFGSSWVHVCNKCGKKEAYTKVYPYIEHAPLVTSPAPKS
jgi:hypothetical protein